jgi:hypothetical protein
VQVHRDEKSRPLTMLGQPGENAVAAQHAAQALIVTNIGGPSPSPMSRAAVHPFESRGAPDSTASG